MKKLLLLAGSSAFLISCAAQTSTYETYLRGKKVPLPAHDILHHCHGYGCKFVSEIKLTDKDWREIRAFFTPMAKSAAAERTQIAKAIGRLEQIAGKQDGTGGDIRGTFRNIGDDQLDCVDESTNTTIFLSLMQTEGLARFHTVEGPAVRLPLIHAGRWPHQTGVIREKDSDMLFAVDSWFHDNGADAEIIELKTWKDGWKPESVRDFL